MPKLLTNGDEVHGDEKQGEGEEAEDALPPGGLQRWHIVLGHELLLVDHMQGPDDLRPNDEYVAKQNVRLRNIPRVVASDDVAQVLVMEEGLLLTLNGGRVVLSTIGAATVEDIADAYSEKSADDEEDPDPLVAEKSFL